MASLKQTLLVLLGAALLGLPDLAVGKITIPAYTQAQIDKGDAIKDLSKKAFDAAMARLPATGTGCTKENVVISKEWRDMPGADRIAYTDAFQCLMTKPSKYPNVAGAKSAFDDFAVLHYYATPYVHNSASFLAFHRWYNWVLLKMLEKECNYDSKKGMPYWEWGLDCADPRKSPLFDGSATSIGSDGAADAGGNVMFGMPGGTGGGCIMKGPFSNSTVSPGPSSRPNPLAANPRCIKRDLNGQICRSNASLRNTTDAILDAQNVEIFQAITQGDSRYPESRMLGMAVHGGGHFVIGGEPGGDFYFSPLEPGFYQHHGNIDRMWFIWQNLDWENRQTIAGTATMMNMPPSAEQKLTDTLDMRPLAEIRTLGELLDSTANTPLCFVYQ